MESLKAFFWPHRHSARHIYSSRPHVYLHLTSARPDLRHSDSPGFLSYTAHLAPFFVFRGHLFIFIPRRSYWTLRATPVFTVMANRFTNKTTHCNHTMCVCMYVCVYVCVYVLCMYVCVYVCMCVYVHMYVYVCMYVCTHILMFVCMFYVWKYLYACMHAYMYILCVLICMMCVYMLCVCMRVLYIRVPMYVRKL